MSFTIAGTGYAHPVRTLDNEELTRMVDTSDEWIVSRTGIRSRYIATTETLTELAVSAARMAMDNAGAEAASIDLVICSTVAGDTKCPTLAGNVLGGLDIRCPAFDVNAACSGFLYALQTAAAYMDAGLAETVLVIAAEMMTRHVDWTDRASCVLFGDGAGAVLLQKGEGLLACRLRAQPDKKNLLVIGQGKSHSVFEETDAAPSVLAMNGPEVFKFAVTSMCRDIKEVLDSSGLGPEDIRYVVPHQANLRILETARQRLGFSEDQIAVNIERYGNTSSASIAILLAELVEQGKLQRGDNIVCTAFGGGLTSAACVIKY